MMEMEFPLEWADNWEKVESSLKDYRHPKAGPCCRTLFYAFKKKAKIDKNIVLPECDIIEDGGAFLVFNNSELNRSVSFIIGDMFHAFVDDEENNRLIFVARYDLAIEIWSEWLAGEITFSEMTTSISLGCTVSTVF